MIYFDNLATKLSQFIGNAEKTVDIFAPYVRLATLEEILASCGKKVRVSLITTWYLKDLANGYSELEVFSYCKKNGIELFLQPRLHLKTVLVDGVSVITGSANITGKGLGLSSRANYETMVKIESASTEYLIYLLGIHSKSICVTDEIHKIYKKALEKYPKEKQISAEEPLDHENPTPRLLVSDLPKSESVSSLYGSLTGNQRDWRWKNAIHDVAIFDLSLTFNGLTPFIADTQHKFLEHPFITLIFDFIDRPRRFGEIKTFIQSVCTDDPTPQRQELTKVVQVLLCWIDALAFHRFEIVRPRYTQIVQPIV